MASESDLIGRIYDCIFDPARWEEVVTRIVEATGSVSGAIITHRAGAAHLTALCGIDTFYADAYVRHYYKINPLAAAAATLSPGEVRAGTPYTQTGYFRASAFYNEFARPQGWADVIAIGLRREAATCAFMTLDKSPDAIGLEPKEWHLLEALAPHLKRAAELNQLLSQSRAMMDSLGAAVAAAGFAVFLMTGDCRILFANAKAEEFLRRGAGLRRERGRLAAATPAPTSRLQALARAAARPARAEGDIGGTIELPRGQDRPPLIAHVIPLAANRTVSIFDFDRPAAAVFVVDPAAKFGGQLRRFASCFRLTAAETRVLREIVGGNGLRAAAARLKISPATAHTHAIRIFAKTGTSRQTELIRLFFEASLPGSPGAPVIFG